MSGLTDIDKMRELALKYALKNAIDHGGKAKVGPVISKIIGSDPSLRPYAREVAKIVTEVVAEVNKLSVEEQVRLLKEKFPETLEERKAKEVMEGLPPLPNADRYETIVTRFAPNPDFLIHLGNARPAILSYEYARMYKGKMILRFEDTDPRLKSPVLDAYKLIKEDLLWLGVKWDEEYVQSLRMEVYYGIVRDLIKVGGAYVDLCKAEEFRKYRMVRKPCPHREQDPEINLDLWDKMLSGHFREGEAVLRIKTDLNYPDPSVIDWVAFRIIDTDKHPHPLTGSRYIVWPTYNFAAAVDDHLMGVTHILRAKEHMTNTIKQKFLYKHLGWGYPETIHFGRLSLEGFILSKSRIRELIGRYGLKVNDIRFGLIASLRRRGIEPEAIRKLIMEVGVKPIDATISWDNLAAINRKLIDHKTIRLMFVRPLKLIIKGVPKDTYVLEIPNHPSVKDLGTRRLSIKCVKEGVLEVFIDRSDTELFKKRKLVRLMEFLNVTPVEVGNDVVVSKYHSKDLMSARRLNAPIIQWVPARDYVNVSVLNNVGKKLIIERGIAEPYVMSLSEGSKAQFVRFGFVKVERKTRKRVYCIFTHT